MSAVRKGRFRHLSPEHLPNNAETENAIIFRHLSNEHLPDGVTKEGGTFYERHLSDEHTVGYEFEQENGGGNGGGGGGGNATTLSIAGQPQITDNGDGTHNLTMIVNYTNPPANEPLVVLIAEGSTTKTLRSIAQTSSPQTLSITNVDSTTGATYNLSVRFNTQTVPTATLNYASPADNGNGGGGSGGTQNFNVATLEDRSANDQPILGDNGKFAVSAGKHTFDRGLNGLNSPTYTPEENPILKLTNRVRYFHDMQNDDYAASGDTPTDSAPAYNPTGFGRMHNTPLVRMKPALEANSNLSIQLTPTTQIGANPPKPFPNRFWRENELGADSASRIANSKAWWDAFLVLYDRTDASEGYLIVDTVEFSNEAWGNEIGINTMKDWIDGMFDAFEAFYNSADPADWRIQIDSGALQAYNAAGRWGAADYVLNVMDAPDFARIDDIGVHNYSFFDGTLDLTAPPENANSEFRHLFTMISLLDTEGYSNDVKSTEYGWDSFDIGEFAQGAYCIRGLMYAGANPRVNMMCWYEDVDNPALGNGLYATSGLLTAVMPNRYQGQDKQIYRMLLQLKNIIGDATPVRFIRQNDICVAILQSVSNANTQFVALWTPTNVNNDTTATTVDGTITNTELAGFQYGTGYLIDGEGLNLDANLGSTSKGTVIDSSNPQGNTTSVELKVSSSMVVYEGVQSIA